MLKSDATEEEKSLALAELMGLIVSEDNSVMSRNAFDRSHDWKVYNPYEGNIAGLAQFAAILLRFPEVFDSVEDVIISCEDGAMRPFNQANILDEILRMNGRME